MQRAVLVVSAMLVRRDRAAAETDVNETIDDATNNALQNAELMTDICTAMVDGGTLTKFCAEQGLRYKIVLRWINDDLDRQSLYTGALTLREAHAKDLIISELIAYMKAQPVDAFEKIDVEGGSPHQVLKSIQDMPPELQRLIAAIEFEEVFEWQGEGKDREKVHVGRIHKIKFWDKPRSIELFMRNLAMLVDRKQIEAKLSLADLVAASPERVKTT